jgi:hypothetical protein
MVDDDSRPEPPAGEPVSAQPAAAVPDDVADSIGESIAGSALPPLIAPDPATGYTPAGVPTLEGVREKIETRYATALGSAELSEDTAAGRTAAQGYEERRRAAADKLDEIRATLKEPEGKGD